MTRIAEYISGPSFSGRIRPLLRGRTILAAGSPSSIAHDDPEMTRIIRDALCGVEDEFGHEVTDANIFASEGRLTAIVKLRCAVPDAVIAVYHDDLSADVEYQILHASPIKVSLGSHTLLLIVSGAEPGRVLDLAYGSAVGQAVRLEIERLGLRVKAVDEEDVEFETYAFPLEVAPADSSGRATTHENGE